MGTKNKYVRIAHTVPREKIGGVRWHVFSCKKNGTRKERKKKGNRRTALPKRSRGGRNNVSVATRKIGHAWPASLLVARMQGCRKKMRTIMTKGSYVVPKP